MHIIFIMGTQIKTTVRNLTPIRMVKSKKLAISMGEDAEQQEFTSLLGGMQK